MNILDNFPLSKVTTLSIGGPAKKFVSISSEEQLKEAIKYAQENNLEYLVIGGGSNLLVSDQGVDKLIIKNEIKGIQQNGNTLIVKSGTILQDLVNYSIAQGLSGLQKLTGIPGSVGGAIYGNAGAYGQTISDHIILVTILDPSSVIPASEPESVQIHGSRLESHSDFLQHGMTKDECQFNYRDSIFKKNHLPILEITFTLETGDTMTMQKQADETLEKRLIKYPVGIKCPGSFFKNIVADTLSQDLLDKVADKIVYGKLPAGALLEEVGAKGDSLGDIEIASYHANLFINKGGGTAEDFYNLAKKYVHLVKEKFGITLEPEVQLINLNPMK